ncbi:MAG: glutathione S-transferase family protein [bacterium]|nr:glutathione S-transferase family protein [bacterium]
MTTSYRIFGSELSPYSVKVRSYFRYKGIPHVWTPRTIQNQAEFDQHAKLPLIPLVLGDDGTAMQDSTPIIEKMEARVPEPSITPADPVAAFVSVLLEEYGDEWGNKPMFHYRWFYEADAQSAAERIARDMNPELPADAFETVVGAVKGRMVPRLAFVGSSEATKDRIEGSYRRQLALLEKHLATRPYLFGGRPAFGDFGVWAQLYECSTDPTPGAIVRAEAPAAQRWIDRMLDPKAEGVFEPWSALAPTLEPFLRDEVAATFLPWTVANAAALAAGEKEFTVQMGGAPFRQETQKYHARSLGKLREKYAAVADRAAVDAILERTGCLAALRG